MTQPTDAQLARIRETISGTMEEWRLSYRIEPRKEDYALECLLVAAVWAMHQGGTITINSKAEGSGSEGE